MFGLTTLRTVTNAAMARRRRRETLRVLNGLSPALKKDIGWPAAAPAGDGPHASSLRG